MNDPSPSGEQAGGEPSRPVTAVAGDHAGEVVAAARDQARSIAQDARAQFDEVARTAQQRVSEQTGVLGERAAAGLRTLADRFGALAAGDPGAAGPFADYAKDVRARASQLAGRLEDGPDAVLDDVRSFARRRPMVFLAGASVAGFLAGRIVMGARDAESQRELGADEGAVGYPRSAMTGASGIPNEAPVPRTVDRQGLPLRSGVPS